MGSVLLAVGNHNSPTTTDTAIESRLVGLGHTVTIVSENGGDQSAGHDLVVCAESSSSGQLGGTYDTTAVPVLLLEDGVFTNMRLASSNAAFHDLITSTQLDEENTHAVHDGLTFPVSWYTSSQSPRVVDISALASGVVALVRPDGSSVSCSGFVADTGATLTTGTAPARRGAYLVNDAQWAELAAGGLDYFDRMVEWVGGFSGAAPPAGSGTLTHGWSVTGSGSRTSQGSGSVAHDWDLSGSGSRQSAGSGVLTHSWSLAGSGTAPAVDTQSGTGTIGHDWTVTGSGTAPAVDAHSGTGSLGHDWALSGTGSRSSSGSGALSHTWAVSGSGVSDVEPARDISLAASATALTWLMAPTLIQWATSATHGNPMSAAATKTNWSASATRSNPMSAGTTTHNPISGGAITVAWSTGPTRI